MKIHKTINPVAYQNTYYLENKDHLLVIDPGSDWPTIKATIEAIGKPITAILLTHAHYDHIISLDLVREQFDQPPVYIAESEASWLFTPKLNLSGLARHDDLPDVICQPAEHFFQYENPYQLDGFAFEVRPTPGHSIGGISLVFPREELVITGDALFRESIGRTDLPTGNSQQLLTSITEQLFTLPSHYMIYPGHGQETSISHEKVYNPFFRA